MRNLNQKVRKRSKEGHEMIVTKLNEMTIKREIFCEDISKFDVNKILSQNSNGYLTDVIYRRQSKDIVIISRGSIIEINAPILREEIQYIATCMDNICFISLNPNEKLRGLEDLLPRFNTSITLMLSDNINLCSLKGIPRLSCITSLNITQSLKLKECSKLKLLRDTQYLPCLKQYAKTIKTGQLQLNMVISVNGNKECESNFLKLLGFGWKSVVSVRAEYRNLTKNEMKYLLNELRKVNNVKIFTVNQYGIPRLLLNKLIKDDVANLA